jgi:beta-glucanase (GH16 family)
LIKKILAIVLFLVSANFIYAQTAPAERLVWSDEFSGPGAIPNPANWTYETGGNGWGNHELETYCAPGSSQPPCNAAQPNAVVEKDGYLHIAARRDPATGAWTSARLISKGLQSFQYGRIEARIRIPAGEGVWPAFWMLGDDIGTHPWPASGELDIMENIGKEPTKIHGSVHGTGFTGMPLGKVDQLPSGKDFAAAFHTYGLIWSPGKIQYYVDDPTHPYATFTPADLPAGAVWPFDDGRYFLLLNLAIGGSWPGPPTAATHSPAEMLVDYVRVYQDVPQP